MMQNLSDFTKKNLKIKETTAYLLILGKSSGYIFHLESIKGNIIYSALWGRRKSRGVGCLHPDQPWNLHLPKSQPELDPVFP